MRLLRRLTLPILLLAAVPATSPATEVEADFAWLSGLSLVLLDSDTPEALHAATSQIHQAGGRVGLMSLPNVLVGWIPPEADATLLAAPGIRQIFRDNVSPTKAIADLALVADVRTQRMLRWFEAVQTGEYQRATRQQMAAAKPSQRGPRAPDSFLPDRVDPIDYLRNLQDNGFNLDELRSRGLILQKGRSGAPQVAGNSDRMTGSINLSMLFVESDGSGADPDLYTWSEQHLQDYINGANAGLLWWAQQAAVVNDCWAAFFVHYIPGTDNRNQQWREMVTHNSSDVAAMASEIMANYGFNSGSHFSRVGAFNTAQRAAYGTDWGYTAFIAYNPPPASTQTPDGKAAFAYLLGPYTFLLQNSHSWAPNQVFPHESGHIFGACDEYSGGCTACNTCLGELNDNCEDCPGGNNACMMKSNSFTLCSYTDEQVGWQDLNPCAPPVLLAPTVSSISPSSIPKGASGVLTISGSNFLHGAFTSLESDVVIDSTVVIAPDTLRLYVTASVLATISTRDVIVSNRDLQSSTLPGAFSVTETRSHYYSSTGSNIFPYLTPAKAANALIDAIAAADSGDSVLVESTTINLTGGFIFNKGVTLYGGWTNNFTTRDLQNNKTVLDLTGGTLSMLSNDPLGLDGFLLQNGSGAPALGPGLLAGEYGGAILINNATASVRNCEIRNNQATDGNGFSGGGGLFAINSILTITNCQFTGNTANRGGALFLYQSSGSISGNTFSGNTVAKAISGGVAPWGAGILVDSCVNGLTFQDNLIQANAGAENGGGIYVINSIAVSIEGGSVENHSVTSAGLATGGGLEFHSAQATLSGVLIAHNSSGFFSGGLSADASNLILEECVFDSNTASLHGGLNASDGTIEINHCLFRDNTASITNGAIALTNVTSGQIFGNTLHSNSGSTTGGMALASSMIDVRNNIISNSTGHGISCSGTPPTALDYNLVWGSTGNDWEGCTPGTNSISADPLLVDAAQGDDHLGLHSPAIDSGDPDIALQDPDGSRGDLGRFGSHDFIMQQPAAPQNLAASSSGSDIILTWTANAEINLASYAVYCDSTMDFKPSADNFVTTVTAPDTTINLGALTCDWLTIAAINSDGYSSGFATRVQQVGGPTDTAERIPYRFRLHANTPNPFNPNTRIDFELDRSRPVRITVYDLAGRQVRRLIDRPLPAGRHSTTWDGRDHRGQRVASGVYFYRLESGDLLETRKMVLLK